MAESVGTASMRHSDAVRGRNDGEGDSDAFTAHASRRHRGLSDHDGGASESWVEISSHPSSSSISSIGDQIVTTGLQVGTGAAHSPNAARRRRLSQQAYNYHNVVNAPSSVPATAAGAAASYTQSRLGQSPMMGGGGTSSQDEEFGEDSTTSSGPEEAHGRSSADSGIEHVIPSRSMEAVSSGSAQRQTTRRSSAVLSPLQQPTHQPAASAVVIDSSSDDESDSDDGHATALGIGRRHSSSQPAPQTGISSATAAAPVSISPTFRPQPNAFSHPPAPPRRSQSTSSPSMPPPPPHGNGTFGPPRPSPAPRAHTRIRNHHHQHGRTPNFMSPAFQADNDAALRASLTTLLSCAAAAARGRGKALEDERMLSEAAAAGPSGAPNAGLGLGLGVAPPPGVPGAGVVPGSAPVELRIVPEAALDAAADEKNATTDDDRRLPAAAPRRRRRSRETASSPAPLTTSPRPTSASSNDDKPGSPFLPPAEAAALRQQQQQQQQRQTARARRTQQQTAGGSSTKKKQRTDGTTLRQTNDGVSMGTAYTYYPSTLMAWVVSAGVVVLVSVVGFGAGYVIGREVGRRESFLSPSYGQGAGASAANVSSCGREVVRTAGAGTLRRFRWGSGMGRGVAA